MFYVLQDRRPASGTYRLTNKSADILDRVSFQALSTKQPLTPKADV